MVVHLSNPSPGPAVTFWGAAQRVTGSMHLVEVAGHKLLLDCGLYLGSRTETRRQHQPFPFHPPDIEGVILSHAHVDHCGNLPHLVRQGFTGPIYCTPATRDLLSLMLADSARIQDEDAFVRGVVGQDEEADVPHSFREDAQRVLRQCIAVPYGRVQEVNDFARFRLLEAGHILGSAMVALSARWDGREVTLAFTGDLGRAALKFLRPPDPLPAADLLLCESTYGGRVHEPVGQMVERLGAVVRQTVERGGKVLIPAFSLGRTQVVVHYLQEGIRTGRLPRVPLVVDSPLAADIAEVYRRYPEFLSPEYTPRDHSDLQEVHYVRSAEESKELAARREPYLLVTSGGMCEGGRIVRHLPHHIDDPRCTLVLVSYQAPHTLGRRLLARGPTVHFRGRKWNKWIEVVEFPGFSGHADHGEILAFLKPLAGRVPRVRLVHGEVEQAGALAGGLREQGFADVEVPGLGETVHLV
jgi:metallo-beta-lactamase family protein